MASLNYVLVPALIDLGIDQDGASIVMGVHVNGVVGALLALGCVFLVRVGGRKQLDVAATN